MAQLTSGIIWQGASPANGAHVVAIISGMTGKSQNDKTGRMAQVDILVANTHPVEARKLGEDSAICGACPLKTAVCYVNVGFGPSAKFRALQRGSYAVITPEDANAILKANNVGVRLGSYGDPAMVPTSVWLALIDGITHTGYTHQWRESWFDAQLLDIVMASIDHVNTREDAKARFPGVRTYRMAEDYGQLGADEIKCPSKARDGSRRVQCADCNLCAGQSRNAKDIVIVEND